jgi:Tol biopolymer transport system component/DNA-directed RNA polymerase specialized sigma24 family protein
MFYNRDMQTRFDLVRLAQAGEPSAIQAFIEQNHASVYRIALTILNDPGEAARAARESEAALIENLAGYPGPGAHTAWVYRITLQVCRRRLRWRGLVGLVPGLRRRSDTSGGTQANLPRAGNGIPEGGLAPKPERIWLAASGHLPDELRLPLILRYMHDLLPVEIAQVLGWSDAAAQARLRQARAQLRRARPTPSLFGFAEGPEQGLSHSQAENLLEAAADFHITDADAGLLRQHLNFCPRCQESSRRLHAFENELRAAFHQRWDGEPVPERAAAGALDQRRRQAVQQRSFNLAGAVLLTVCMVGLIVLLPALLPDRVLPPPPAAPPPAASAAPTLTRTATVTPTATATATAQPRSAGTFRARPTGTTLTPRAFNPRELFAQVYPGKIAFTAFHDLTNHIFTLEPGKNGTQQLSGGLTENSFPVWSPDGSQVAYLSMPQGGGRNQIFVVNVDGSNRFQVTPVEALQPTPGLPASDPKTVDPVQYPIYGPPHWSADGKRLVSAMWASATSRFVVIFPVNGGTAQRLPVAGLERNFVDWSPDGSTIAYLGKDGRELWLWEPTQPLKSAENPKKLYSDGAWDMVFGMAWSPDSYSLAVMGGLREQDVVQVDLRIVRKYSVEARNIPVSTGILTSIAPRSSNLVWSPDGVYLAFTPVFTNSDLTHGQVLLARAEGRSTLLPGLATLERAVSGLAWSPDGRWLAFAAETEIWVTSLDAYERSEPALLRLSRSAASSLSWQPKLLTGIQ